MKFSRLLVPAVFTTSVFVGCQVSDMAAPTSADNAAKPGSGLKKSEKDRSECGLPQNIVEPDWPKTLVETTEQEPDPIAAGTTTIAVLPDTQYYASCDEIHFPIQGKWLASQIEKRNIIGAIHLGDLTEHNDEREWGYVEASLKPLFDKVPLLLATGNHDHGDGGTANERQTLFRQYFGSPREATKSTVAEVMTPGDLENAYYRLPLEGATLGVLILEWSPRKKTVEWARAAVSKYESDRKIFVTHAYLYHDSTRYDFAGKGENQPWNPFAYGTAKRDPKHPYSEKNAHPEGTYDGEMLWNELLIDMPGLFLTLNGHVLGDGAGLLTSEGKDGALVHQVLTNFQMLNEGGLGYLRLIEISEDGSRMQMKTYSPSLKQFATAENQHFSLPIQPPLF